MDESKDDDADTSVVEKAASILMDEVREAIKRLPCGKAAGYDDLPAKLIKWESDVNRKGVLQIVQPDSWRRRRKIY